MPMMRDLKQATRGGGKSDASTCAQGGGRDGRVDAAVHDVGDNVGDET